MVVGCRDINAPQRQWSLGSPNQTVSDTDCPITHPDCVLRPLTQAEKDDMEFIIYHVRSDPACWNISSDLQWRLDNDIIKAFDTDFGTWGDYHTAGPATGQLHVWRPDTNGYGQLPLTLLHEGAHATGILNEQSAESMANYCWLGD